MVTEGPRVPAVLTQPAAVAIDIKVRLHVELAVMTRAEQVVVLHEVGTFIAERLERMARR
jgi:hypothetical protein